MNGKSIVQIIVHTGDKTMSELTHYKWYKNPDDFPDEYDVCLEHPTAENFTLCSGVIDQTPDGNPEETNEPINCNFCLEVIKTIKELPNV